MAGVSAASIAVQASAMAPSIDAQRATAKLAPKCGRHVAVASLDRETRSGQHLSRPATGLFFDEGQLRMPVDPVAELEQPWGDGLDAIVHRLLQGRLGHGRREEQATYQSQDKDARLCARSLDERVAPYGVV